MLSPLAACTPPIYSRWLPPEITDNCHLSLTKLQFPVPLPSYTSQESWGEVMCFKHMMCAQPQSAGMCNIYKMLLGRGEETLKNPGTESPCTSDHWEDLRQANGTFPWHSKNKFPCRTWAAFGKEARLANHSWYSVERGICQHRCFMAKSNCACCLMDSSQSF